MDSGPPSPFLPPDELSDLASRLIDLGGLDTPEQLRCCCDRDCIRDGVDRLESRLKISGQVGDALLRRYEALERKYQKAVEQYEHQVGRGSPCDDVA